jgi:hypothetical protein
MASSPNPKLDSIRIQTARMLEIYALLRRQLKEGNIHLPPEKYDQLSGAIRTIAKNMLQLQSYHAAHKPEEQTSSGTEREEVTSRGNGIASPPNLNDLATSASLTPKDPASEGLPVSPAELQELDDIVNQVLEWHMANGGVV